MLAFTHEETMLLRSQPPAVVVNLLRRFYWYPRLKGECFIQVRSTLLELLEEDQSSFQEHETEFTHYNWGDYVGPLWDRAETPARYQIEDTDARWTTANPELIAIRFLGHAATCDIEQRMIPAQEYALEIADIKSVSKIGRLVRAVRKNTGSGWERSGETLERRDRRNREAKELARSLGFIR